jgi:CheY-like chemotaxis protein
VSESSSVRDPRGQTQPDAALGDGPESGLTSAETFACALHEVGNALTVVLGWLDVASSCESMVDARAAIAVAREHARRGQIMTRRAIGAAVPSSHDERTAAHLVEFAAKSVRPQADPQGVTLRTRAGNGTSTGVHGSDVIVQVLTNLLLNGIAFSPTGGTVLLEVERRGQILVFTVSDEGPGIPASRRAELFHAPQSTRSGGAGIGLPHSRHLARQAGGDLSLVPSTCGACFELVWPLPQTGTVRPSLAPDSGTHLADARVLVIEDDLALSTLVELSFGARGAEVIVAPDRPTLDAILAGRPVLDLILLDLSPIEGDLDATLAALTRAAPQAPIVLMSGQPTGVPPEADGRVECWVRKPFDMEELVRTARDLLARPAASGPAASGPAVSGSSTALE